MLGEAWEKGDTPGGDVIESVKKWKWWALRDSNTGPADSGIHSFH
jgi:hypothetical protein